MRYDVVRCFTPVFCAREKRQDFLADFLVLNFDHERPGADKNCLP